MIEPVPTPAPVAALRRLALASLAAAGLLLTACGGPTAAPRGADAEAVPVHVSDAAPPHAHPPTALAADAPLPGASLYHLDATWTDHRGEPLVLGDLRGHPVVVVMIYASCETACPVLVRDALRLDAALTDAARDDTRVLLVTFDTENDAPERLAAYVEANGLEDPRWRFAVGGANDTRALAAMLGVRYRPAGNGMFSHSNLITVLGRDGVPLARSEGLGAPSEPLVAAIEAAPR